MESNNKKEYNYGYQPLDESSGNGAEETGVHNNLADAYELKDLKNDTNNTEEPESDVSLNGLSIATAGIFIIGEICGAGAISFPLALSKTGLFGLLLVVIIVLACVYCGLLLGWCWKKISEQRTEKTPLRDPYPYIGEVAVGKGLRHAITFTLNLQLFLTCVVYLLLSSEIVSSFITFHVGSIHSQGNLRIWLILITLLILPLTWLGTPKDFWFVALAAAGSTSIALILIWIKYGLIAPPDLGTVEKAEVTWRTFASAFGTFVFGFTGASLFPTIQSDMKKPGEFAKAAYLGYIGIFLLYVPTAIGGYIVLGADIQPSILKTLAHYDEMHHTSRAIVSVAELLFAAHFVAGFVLMLNPVLQQLEEFFEMPRNCSAKRISLRSLVVLAILVTCEIFPQFGPIVDLVGGSINVFLCFIFPVWCYLKLYPETSTKEKMLMAGIVVLAVVGGLVSTVSNFLNISKAFHEIYFAENATGHPQ